MIQCNLVAPMKLTMLLAPQLTTRQGYIINISSVAGRDAIKGQAAYCASKHGMTGWSLTCYEVSALLGFVQDLIFAEGLHAAANISYTDFVGKSLPLTTCQLFASCRSFCSAAC